MEICGSFKSFGFIYILIIQCILKFLIYLTCPPHLPRPLPPNSLILPLKNWFKALLVLA